MADGAPSGPDIFLSYAREDEARARELAMALGQRGFSVFWDREVPPGQTWHSYIGEALANAKCVVVAWSRHSVTSQWVIEEASEGKDRYVLVPVLFEIVPPPFGFRAIQAANLVGWRSGRSSPAFDNLVGAVQRIVGGQAGSGTVVEPDVPLPPQRAPTEPARSPKPSGPAMSRLASGESRVAAKPPAGQGSTWSHRTVLAMIVGFVALAGAGGGGVLWWLTQPGPTGPRAVPPASVAEPGPSVAGPKPSELVVETAPTAALVLVPDLVGYTLDDTRAVYPELSIEVAGREPSDDPRGTILRQEPAAGEPLPSDREFWLVRVWLAEEVRSAVSADTGAPGEEMRDCPECPEMVLVPAGEFTMGSPPAEPGRGDDEGPQHKVTIAAPFWVGKHEVTFAEWDACVAAGGCSNKPYDAGWGRDTRPVINASWNDATEYVGWLSQKTGNTYRLLSEAEWEYVARAGTATVYWWGDEAGRGNANCSGCGSEWDDTKTAPLGSFKANDFGLYDTAGNVWEWVQDCYHDSYDGAPTDGSAWEDGDGCSRVVRGGSRLDRSGGVRSANRNRVAPDSRVNLNLGFRVARVPD